MVEVRLIERIDDVGDEWNCVPKFGISAFMDCGDEGAEWDIETTLVS